MVEKQLTVNSLRFTENKKLFLEAQKYLVGGVNSPVRSFKAVEGEPLFIKSASGSRLYSEDGGEFIDYCMSWGALILGHGRPEVVETLKDAFRGGTSFGAATRHETELAKVIIDAIPSIEKIRFTNSGTEAVMTAIRLARAFTKRDVVMRFEGSYHGHADYLIDSAGVPEDFKRHTLSVSYNDIKAVEETAKRRGSSIACIIVEPVAGNMGVVLPKELFLESLRRIADAHGIMLIFDEVITGFRLIFGGAQNLFAVSPDLTCLGKIIGGGLPIGAVGGRGEIMRLLAPEGGVYQAGTFSGNPVSMKAGLAALKILKHSNPYGDLEKATLHLVEGLRSAVKVNCIGSMFSIFFTDKEITDYNIAKAQDIERFKRFYHFLIKEGVYFAPSPFETNFLSTAHTPDVVEKTKAAFDKAIKNLRG